MKSFAIAFFSLNFLSPFFGSSVIALSMFVAGVTTKTQEMKHTMKNYLHSKSFTLPILCYSAQIKSAAPRSVQSRGQRSKEPFLKALSNQSDRTA